MKSGVMLDLTIRGEGASLRLELWKQPHTWTIQKNKTQRNLKKGGSRSLLGSWILKEKVSEKGTVGVKRLIKKTKGAFEGGSSLLEVTNSHAGH